MYSVNVGVMNKVMEWESVRNSWNSIPINRLRKYIIGIPEIQHQECSFYQVISSKFLVILSVLNLNIKNL